VRSAEDPDVLKRVVDAGVALEVCPTSNVATKVVATLDEHPVRQMVAAGVTVTINSDDPPMFGTTLNREYAIAADLLGLDESGLGELAKTAVQVSFADDALKQTLGAEIDVYVADWLSRAGS
jgi:aminodeoxyfutalosine deaminase